MRLPQSTTRTLALLLATGGFALAQDTPLDPRTDASTAPPAPRPAQDAAPEFDEPFPWPAHLDMFPGDEAAGSVQGTPAPKGPGDLPPSLTSSLSFRDLMTEPQLQRDPEGVLWARTRDQRVRFDGEGLTVLPIFGSASPQEWPLELELASAVVGGTALDTRSVAGPAQEGKSVRLDRADLDEVHHLTLDGVEQTFVLDRLDVRGELVLRLDVETELQPQVDGDLLRFTHPEFGYVDYGTAIAFDASGARTPVSRTLEDDQIVLRVPAAFVQEAVLPLTVDPIMNSFSSSFGAQDDSHPDICYAGGPGLYFVCWEEYSSATNSDVYLTNFTSGGTQGTSIAVEITSDHWATPRVAYVPANDRLLVVASRTTDGPGTGSGSIQGQIVSASFNTLVGSSFIISTIGSFKVEPDVGGTNYESTTNNHFLVAWSRILSTTQRSIEYRCVDWDGSFVTGVTTVVSETDVQARQPAISDSHGDATLSGDWWTLAWVRDTGGVGRGQIWARRVVWNGNTALGQGNFLVNSSADCANPSVTSRFDENLAGTSDRPSIVAYDRRFLVFFPTLGTQRTVYANVVTDGQAYPAVSVNTQEDFNTGLDQFSASIVTDGTGFLLGYSEEYWNDLSGDDDDVYMTSGHIAFDQNGPSLALAERHQNLAFSGLGETQVRLAADRDGDNQFGSDNGAAIWMRETGTDNGLLAGATLDIDTLDGSFSVAVGVQFCDALPNSTGSYGGNNASWMSVRGNTSIASTHVAQAENLPLNMFGYLLCSLTPTTGVVPAGSEGRLCLGGTIGRFNSQIGFSGTSGTLATNITPSALPLGSGPVSALPGQTWHFQFWHRDVVNSVSTSNFTNACSVTFQP